MLAYNQNPETAAQLAAMSKQLAEQAALLAEKEAVLDARAQGEKMQFSLTPQESAVADGCAMALSNKAIAQMLGLSESTVKIHLKAVLRKTACRNRTEVALLRYGILPSEVKPAEVREALQ